jgi:ferredoxin
MREPLSKVSIMISQLVTVSLLLATATLVNALSTPFGKTTRNIATQTLQGAGPASVDLNQYNLPLETIEEEWCAVAVQKTAENEEGVYLGCKSNSKIFVDTFSTTFPRKEGMGIKLLELAGGRDDDLGITVVSGLVPGGSAEGSEITTGDSIAEVSLIRTKTQIGDNLPISEQNQEWTVKTECFSYAATVKAIQSLPPKIEGYDDYFTVKVRRLRTRPKIRVKLQYPPDQNEPDSIIEMNAGENLRQGMLVRGVKLNDPLAKRFDTKSGGNCGAGGLCRTCQVTVVNGGELLNDQRVAEKQMLADSPRSRLACKAIVGFGMREGDMTIRVNPNQW